MSKHAYPFVALHPADRGGCSFYRVIWPATALIGTGRMNGLITDRLMTRMEVTTCRPEIILTQRQYYDFQLDTLEDYRKSGTFVIYELDDILTHVPEWSPHYKDFPKDIKARLKRAFSSVNKIVTSTPKLKEQLQQLAGRAPIQVLHNYLPPIWKDLERYNPRQNKKFRIGWAGALAHEMDLEILKPVMAHFKDRVQWVFMGLAPTNMPEGCDVEKVNGVPLEHYARAVEKLSLNLAVIPLEVNMLNRCKSGIRVMELGICGCPIIASDLEPYRPFNSITRVRNETDQWVAAIEDHLANPERCYEQGQTVREEIINGHMLMEHLDEVMNAWNLEDKTPAFIPKGIQERPKEVVEYPFTVVVSCHSAPELTKNCLESLIAARDVNKTPYKIIALTGNVHPDVIKAAEPLKDKLDGFITEMSVNEVIAENPGHIIWTRGNTVVFGDWLDRMKKIMDQNLDAASFSPFMNEQTIIGVLPQENSPACMFPGKDGWGADYLASQHNQQVGIPAPLPGRNFILFRKEALENCGYFDEGSYNLGYRMTDDWAILAGFHGWKHLIIPTVFVSVFGEPGYDKLQEIQKQSSQCLGLRYPAFLKSYTGRDSSVLAGHKANFELLCAASDKSSVFVVAGQKSLESDLYIKKLGEKLAEQNLELFIVRPAINNSFSIEKKDQPFNFIGNPTIIGNVGFAIFLHILKTLKCQSIDIHSLYDYHYTMPDFLLRVAEETKLDLDFSVTTMEAWCPQIYMFWKTQDRETVDTFCNRELLSTCEKCVKIGTEFGFVRIGDWLHKYAELLSKCRHIYIPSDTCWRYANKYIGGFSNKFKQIQLNSSIKFAPTAGNKILILRTPTSLREVEAYKEMISTVTSALFIYAGQGHPFGAMPNLAYLQQLPQNLQQWEQFFKTERPTYYLDMSKYPKMLDTLGTFALNYGVAPIVMSEGPTQEIIDNQHENVGATLTEVSSPVVMAGMMNEMVRDSLLASATIEFENPSKMGESQ